MLVNLEHKRSLHTCMHTLSNCCTAIVPTSSQSIYELDDLYLYNIALALEHAQLKQSMARLDLVEGMAIGLKINA